MVRGEEEDARLPVERLEDREVHRLQVDHPVSGGLAVQELRQARLRISELESAEPEEIVREVTVTKVVPDPQVVADLNAAKETRISSVCTRGAERWKNESLADRIFCRFDVQHLFPPAATYDED